jgi:hypothetical protein
LATGVFLGDFFYALGLEKVYVTNKAMIKMRIKSFFVKAMLDMKLL